MGTTLALLEPRDLLLEPPQHPIDYLSFSGLKIPAHVKLWHLRNYQKNLYLSGLCRYSGVLLGHKELLLDLFGDSVVIRFFGRGKRQRDDLGIRPFGFKVSQHFRRFLCFSSAAHFLNICYKNRYFYYKSSKDAQSDETNQNWKQIQQVNYS